MHRLRILAFASLLHALPAFPASDAAPPGAEHFARRPLINGVTLSPDGKHIAGLMNLPDGTVLVTQGTEYFDSDGHHVASAMITITQFDPKSQRKGDE